MASKALHPSYQLAKQLASDVGVTELWQLGDWFEFEYLASFNQSNLKKLTEDTFKADYEVANRELDDWQAIVQGPIYWLQGNHDRRVERLVEREPALEGLVEPEVRLHLRDRGIRHYREEDQPVRVHEGRYALHGRFTNRYHASKHLQAFMVSVIYGHVHADQSDSIRHPITGRLLKAQSLPCLTGLQPPWMHGTPTRHSHGLALEDGQQLHVLNMDNGGFRWNQKWYSLAELETSLAQTPDSDTTMTET